MPDTSRIVINAFADNTIGTAVAPTDRRAAKRQRRSRRCDRNRRRSSSVAMSSITGFSRRPVPRSEQRIWLGPIFMGLGLTICLMLLICFALTD